MYDRPALNDLPLFDDRPTPTPEAAGTYAGGSTSGAVPTSVSGPPPSGTWATAHGRRARDPRAGNHGHVAGLDWALVRAFRQQAAEQLAAALREREGVDGTARRQLGREIVQELLTAHTNDALADGAEIFSRTEQQELAEAILDALFGLGRLQPLVDDPRVENIDIDGYDNVQLVYADGRIEAGPPVADSDDELIEFLAFLGSRSGGTERPFSPSDPFLDKRLDGGGRLAASAWVSPRPQVSIRLNRLKDIDLDGLIGFGLLDTGLASFLQAAVRAKKSIVVSGQQSAGKTTLVRALCNELDPMEPIGTIESDFELHLHELPDRHRLVRAWEGRPGSGERGPDGRRVGEVTLDELVYHSLRFNLSRTIVGEVRGPEIIAFLKAMQSGYGSLSTTHAHSARAAIERLVTCALEAGPHITEQFAYRQIAQHIDLIVQITLEDSSVRGGRRRYISEVIAVEPGEHGQPAVTDVYRPGEDGRATPGTLPQWLSGLARHGFDVADFTGRRSA